MRRVVPRHPDTIPPVEVNRVANEIMGAADFINEIYAVPPVVINEIIGNQGLRITARNGNAAITGISTIVDDPIAFDMNGVVLIIAAEQADRLPTGFRNRQPTNGDEFGLLEPDSVPIGTDAASASEHDAAWGCGRVSLNDYPVGFGRRWRVVEPGEGQLLLIATDLNTNRFPRLHGSDRLSDIAITGIVALTGRVSVVDIANRAGWLRQ